MAGRERGVHQRARETAADTASDRPDPGCMRRPEQPARRRRRLTRTARPP